MAYVDQQLFATEDWATPASSIMCLMKCLE